MKQNNRLPEGGRIDRARPIRFVFNGKQYHAYQGDTLASALLANDLSIVGRSFKYHRPRGIVGAGPEEPNALMQIGSAATTEPVQRATQVELYDGLVARSIKGWPSLNFDLGRVNDVLSKVFSAGFYYKTFMQPAKFWHFYESVIRRSAGLGKSPLFKDPDHYSHKNAHCDVLVVGAGPTGLMAAYAAAKSGANVIIADEQNEFGGSLLATQQTIDGIAGPTWASRQFAALRELPNVSCLPRSTVFGYYDYNFLGIMEKCTNHVSEFVEGQIRQRLWRVRAKQVVLAQGAFERPLVFANNDRPGVMVASAVSTYIKRYAVLPGRRAIVVTNNDSAYQTALDLFDAGAKVVVVDCRASGGELSDRAERAGIQVYRRSVLTHAHGRSKVRAASIAALDASGELLAGSGSSAKVSCDLIAVSGGWSPAVHLHSHSGGRNKWCDSRLCFVPGDAVQLARSAGAGNGAWSLSACLDEGRHAGGKAAAECGFEVADIGLPETELIKAAPIQALWRVPLPKLPEREPKQFIDFQNDTSVADIRLAVREGFSSVEHVKRYTAMGFGTDQGKLGNINGMAVLAETLEKTIPEVGTTTFRPAYTPVSFGACAGEDIGSLHEPSRKTAIHDWHVSRNAPMEVVGQWDRPWYFPEAGEDLHAAVRRESLAVRQSVGIMDASTLGKIDVRGPDAVKFLEMMYTHDIGKMNIGRCAYGIMLGEDGMVMDDGVMARLGDDHFYLTTTTGGAANVLSWLELWLQTEWPEWQVYLTSLTDQYSTMAVAGPESRNVLERMGCDVELDKESFPFMSVRNARLAGVEVQLFRVSFSGELAFEINVPSQHACAVWEAAIAAGEDWNITPYGTETMHVLRAEKGFVIVGQDTDGSVSPIDLRMGWMMSKTKDYLGRRSLSRSDSQRNNRKQLVGLVSVDGKTVVSEGAALVADTGQVKEGLVQGHVSSSYFSPTLEHPIALALLESGHSRKGEKVVAVDSSGKEVEVEVVSSIFYDPKGERQHV